MGLIELLFVIGILYVLYAYLGFGPQHLFLWIIVVVAVFLIVFLIFQLLTKSVGLAFIGEGHLALRKYRRRLKIGRLLHEKRYGEAEAFLKEILRRDPSDNEASRALSEIYLRQKRYEDFLAEKERYLSEGYRVPGHEKCAAYNRIADFYLTHFNNPDRALMALNQIILDFPDTKEATFARKRMNQIAERMRKENDGLSSDS